MRAFIAVVYDLLDFAVTLVSHRRSDCSQPPVAMSAAVESNHSTVRGVIDAAVTTAEPLFGQSRSFVGVPSTRVFMRPVRAFDTVVATLVMATEVRVEAYEGAFAFIRAGVISGWVLKGDLTSSVWPQFVDRETYGAEHPVTRHVRNLISDEFFATEFHLPIQPQEFVLVRLMAEGRRLPFVKDRPRTVGQWHTLYRGVPGVRMGLEPKTGSVMEVVVGTDPWLAFVTAVPVGDSIIIESIGRYQEGEYRTETLEKQDWREFRPVFIQF